MSIVIPRRAGKQTVYRYNASLAIAKQQHGKRSTGRKIANQYTLNLLSEESYLRLKCWDTTQNNPLGIEKRLTQYRQKQLTKLNRYYDRSHTGR